MTVDAIDDSVLYFIGPGLPKKMSPGAKLGTKISAVSGLAFPYGS